VLQEQGNTWTTSQKGNSKIGGIWPKTN